jgi:hypothetical protein
MLTPELRQELLRELQAASKQAMIQPEIIASVAVLNLAYQKSL